MISELPHLLVSGRKSVMLKILFVRHSKILENSRLVELLQMYLKFLCKTVLQWVVQELVQPSHIIQIWLGKIQLYFKFDYVEPSFLHERHVERWNFRHKPIFLGVKLIAIHIFFWLDPKTYVFSKQIPHLIIVSVDTQLDAFLSWLM